MRGVRLPGRRGIAGSGVLAMVGACAVAVLWGVAAPAAQAALPSECSQSTIGGAVTCTYTSVGEHAFTVPSGVTKVDLSATGAAGGGDTFDIAGAGGFASVDDHAVTSGATLYVEVGGKGGRYSFTEGGAGGFNGGGAGGSSAFSDIGGWGGGGASDVRTSPRADGGSLATRILVAAGGGGATHGGNGGDGGDPGTDGGTSHGSYLVGHGATTSAGGAGGHSGGGSVGSAGILGQGGSGGTTSEPGGTGGGGGGGGYYGGGGGAESGGGGGGSDYAPGGTSGTAAVTDPAQVTITYTPDATAASIAITPATASIAAGGSQTFQAISYNADGASVADVTAATTFSGGPDVTCTGASCTFDVPGDYTITGQDGTFSATAHLTVTAAPAFTADTPGDGQVDSAFSYTFVATGNPAPTFSVATTDLPPGLNLNPSTGVLSGTPTATGTYTYTVTASNGVVPDATVSVTQTVNAASPTDIAVASGNHQSAQVGTAFGAPLTAQVTDVLGKPVEGVSVTFAVTGGSASFSGSTTVATDASGVATAPTLTAGASTGTVTITATAAGVATPASFTETVTAAPVTTTAPSFTADTPPATAVAGTAYRYTFAASGTPEPGYSVTSGTLPPGLSLDASTGVLSGTPTTAGSYTFTVTADNGVGSGAAVSITLTVAPRLEVTTTSLPAATVGVAYTATLTATGGDTTSGHQWSISSGSLPAGIGLDGSTGVLSGTPTIAGRNTFTVSVDDPATATLTLVVHAAAPPSGPPTPSSGPTGTGGAELANTGPPTATLLGTAGGLLLLGGALVLLAGIRRRRAG